MVQQEGSKQAIYKGNNRIERITNKLKDYKLHLSALIQFRHTASVQQTAKEANGTWKCNLMYLTCSSLLITRISFFRLTDEPASLTATESQSEMLLF